MALFAALAVALFVYPLLRAFSMVQISYNEGWNVYNAVAAAHRWLLYPHRYGWTTVNYPALSFYIVASLHRMGLGYLAAGRMLSLISLPLSCLLVGLVVWRLNGDPRAALLAAFFCMALFCIAGSEYVGSDDPQIFAQVFFLCGLLVYISGPPRFPRLALTALLFILGGNIKHSLVEFPLAVLVDLAFTERKRVLQYVSISATLLALSIYVNTTAGGPFFVADVLTPRVFHIAKAFIQFMEYGFGPLSLAIVAAAIWSVGAMRESRLRVLAILFWLCVFVGAVSGGVVGAWVNCYFDLFLSTSMIVGLIIHKVWQGQTAGRLKWAAVGAPLALLLSFVPVWAAGPPIMPWAASALPKQQERFLSEVSFIRAHPGPAFCESLLRCYEAGKPYEYDPFNSANLVERGKLDPGPLIGRLKRGKLAVVQLCCSIGFLEHDDDPNIIRQTLPAIDGSYRLALVHKGCYIYLPKRVTGIQTPSRVQPGPVGIRRRLGK